MLRIDSVLSWDKEAFEATTDIKKTLSDKGTPIGANDTAIAGHAITSDCVLVTNNTQEFERVPALHL
jgi:tRNA(fMet)-specific endonuclease VapC